MRACTSGSGQWPTTVLRATTHPRLDEAGLPVAVGGLVKVHEVHVDLSPGQIPVELRVQVEERLLSA